MSSKLLKKGIEVELYAGTHAGEVLPLSTKLSKHFSSVSQEPDERNFEYITNPTEDYSKLKKEIIEPRMKIREFLKAQGNLTLIPGSTIALPFEKKFYFSKPGDPYHEYICKQYKTSVITTSLHINFGIEDYETLFKALCALRLDMPLFLALSASSCFHDGKPTGYYSYRWHSFPKTPKFVPFFKGHKDYINWVNEKLNDKTMFNVRHHWTSIRPNGPDRPHKLNRIEIRICDLVTNVNHCLAIVALIETILYDYLLSEKWPLIINQPQKKLNDLVKIIESQEELVAKNGLRAEIWDWRNDTTEEAASILDKLYNNLNFVANKLGIYNYLKPLQQILEYGNEAEAFLKCYTKNSSIELTIQNFINQFNNMDLESANMLQIN